VSVVNYEHGPPPTSNHHNEMVEPSRLGVGAEKSSITAVAPHGHDRKHRPIAVARCEFQNKSGDRFKWTVMCTQENVAGALNPSKTDGQL